MAQVLEHLTSKHEALSSKPSTFKNSNTKNQNSIYLKSQINQQIIFMNVIHENTN
jgi:hypothetical protein